MAEVEPWLDGDDAIDSSFPFSFGQDSIDAGRPSSPGDAKDSDGAEGVDLRAGLPKRRRDINSYTSSVERNVWSSRNKIWKKCVLLLLCAAFPCASL